MCRFLREQACSSYEPGLPCTSEKADTRLMASYPLSKEMTAFVEKTVSFNSTDSSLAGLRQAYSDVPGVYSGTSRRVVCGRLRVVWRCCPLLSATRQRYVASFTCRRRLGGGGPGLHDFICAELASTPVLVIAVDYRRAPEHPFPAAFDDCLKVWRALRTGLLKLDPERMLVAGDSAGGNLAAALCLALRDAGEPLPCAQVLIYPGLRRRSPAAIAQ